MTKYSPNKNNIINSCLIITSIIITLALGEFFLRTKGIYPKLYGFWMYTDNNDTNATVIIDANRLFKQNPGMLGVDPNGFRNTPKSIGNNKLIVTFGDSFTWGYRLKDEDSYPSVLQKTILNSKNQVANASNPGYGVDQEYVFLKEIIASGKQPNIVLWNINVNDIYDSNSACLYTITKQNNLKELSYKTNLLYIYKSLPKPISESYLVDNFFYRLGTYLTGIKNELRYTPNCTINTNDKTKIKSVFSNKLQLLFSKANLEITQAGGKLIIVLMPNQFFFQQGLDNAQVEEKINYNHIVNSIKNTSLTFIDLNRELSLKLGRDIYDCRYRNLNCKSNHYEDLSQVLFLSEKYDPGIDFGERHPTTQNNQFISDIILSRINSLLY